MIIEKFLNNHPEFSPYPLKPAFEKFNIELPGLGDDDFQYQLLPSVHGCDGFFFSKLIHK
jgi:16S rRNA C967 or C1407 C5-methylase (RsmB/RsmF family)